MRALVIGGSGYVASITLPYLIERHELRIYDRTAPKHDAVTEFIAGDACDFEAVRGAAEGCEALLYMAMGRFIPIGTPYAENVDALTSSLDANVKGVYLSLYAANTAGVQHAVYTSSMSIYSEESLFDRYFPDEEITPDARDVYGLTKRMGELSCQNICRERGMSVNALRLCFPRPDADWRVETSDDKPTLATAASDVARALEAALHYRAGFQAFMLSGDYKQKMLNMSKAKRLLGWEPLVRPER